MHTTPPPIRPTPAAADVRAAAVVYCRSATAAPPAGEADARLTAQADAIQAFATRHGYTVPPTLMFADGAAGHPDACRPGFQALLAHCRAHPQAPDHPGYMPGYMIVSHESRFGRWPDPHEWGRHVDALAALGRELRPTTSEHGAGAGDVARAIAAGSDLHTGLKLFGIRRRRARCATRGRARHPHR